MTDTVTQDIKPAPAIYAVKQITISLGRNPDPDSNRDHLGWLRVTMDQEKLSLAFVDADFKRKPDAKMDNMPMEVAVQLRDFLNYALPK